MTAAVRRFSPPSLAHIEYGGSLGLPGDAHPQRLARIHKQRKALNVRYLGKCRFVKPIGAYGWEE